MRALVLGSLPLAVAALACLAPDRPEIPEGYPELEPKVRSRLTYDVDGVSYDAVNEGLGIVLDDAKQAYEVADTDDPGINVWFPALEAGTYDADGYPAKVSVWFEGAFQSENCTELGTVFATVTVAGSVEFEGQTYRYGDFEATVCGIVPPIESRSVKGKFSGLVEDL